MGSNWEGEKCHNLKRERGITDPSLTLRAMISSFRLY